MVALLSGQVQLYFATISTALPHVKSGKIRALAVTQREALDRRAGISDDRRSRRSGLRARLVGRACSRPRRRHRPSSRALHAQAVKALARDDVKAPLLRDGLEPVGDYAPGIRARHQGRSGEVDEGGEGGRDQAAVAVTPRARR